MNPYEAPQAGNERIPEHRKQKLIVAVAMAVGAGMIMGLVTFFLVRAENARAMDAAMIRAEQAAQAEALRAREAALKAKNQNEL